MPQGAHTEQACPAPPAAAGELDTSIIDAIFAALQGAADDPDASIERHEDLGGVSITNGRKEAYVYRQGGQFIVDLYRVSVNVPQQTTASADLADAVRIAVAGALGTRAKRGLGG